MPAILTKITFTVTEEMEAPLRKLKKELLY